MICKYNDKVYKQIDGTAMGTLVAPPFANLFLFILERILLLKYKEYILFYKRYIDDIFFNF